MVLSFRFSLGVVLVLLAMGPVVPGAQAKWTSLARSRRAGVLCKSVADCQSGECCPEKLGRCLPLLTEGHLCRPFSIQRGHDCPCTVGLQCNIPNQMKSRPVVVQSGTCASVEAQEEQAHETSKQAPRPGPGAFRPGGGRRVPSQERVRNLIHKMAGATAVGRRMPTSTGRRVWRG
ncbi:uncharacterized protein LOC144873227 [Branchiostoma floridae x Branchiostoma japonicum]